MLMIGTLAKVAAQIYGCNLEDLLSYCEHADGSVVIIAPTGQKFAYSADEIMAKVLESTRPAPDVATGEADIPDGVVAKPEGLESVRQGNDDAGLGLVSGPEAAAGDPGDKDLPVAKDEQVAEGLDLATEPAVPADMSVTKDKPAAKPKQQGDAGTKTPARKRTAAVKSKVDEDTPS